LQLSSFWSIRKPRKRHTVATGEPELVQYGFKPQTLHEKGGETETIKIGLVLTALNTVPLFGMFCSSFQL
jgi:hypothetical protein